MTCNNPFASPWKVPAASVPALVFGLGILLLLPSIWSETSVTGMDEYWLSFRTPMEMRERGDWLTPWVNGEPRLQKPPLIYWAILLNYKLFGVSLVSARIWGVLAGAGLEHLLQHVFSSKESIRVPLLFNNLINRLRESGLNIPPTVNTLSGPMPNLNAPGVVGGVRQVSV